MTACLKIHGAKWPAWGILTFAKERLGKSEGIVAISVVIHGPKVLFKPNGWVYNKAEHKAEKGRFFIRSWAPQSKRHPTKCAEIERKRVRKTVDKTRSISRINGNEPGDREQSAGASLS